MPDATVSLEAFTCNYIVKFLPVAFFMSRSGMMLTIAFLGLFRFCLDVNLTETCSFFLSAMVLHIFDLLKKHTK